MGTKVLTFIGTEKSTGKRYWYECKEAWRNRYYDFGDGKWYSSRGEAFRAAQAEDKLIEVPAAFPPDEASR